MIIQWVFVAFAACFLAFHFVLVIGLSREAAKETPPLSGEEGLPFVSIIIPAKNEASRIAPLFESLGGLDYPRFEVIFVEDCSSDDTAALLDAFAATQPAGRIRLLRLETNPGPNFKQYALARGLEAAQGDFFLFTDADCSFGPRWARAMVAPLVAGAGAAAGSVLRRVEGPGFFQSFQAFDHAVRFMYIAGTIGVGAPCGGFGNNMAVSRAALDALGGYGSIPFSPTEDAALISALRTRGGCAVRAALMPAARVSTAPEESWSSLAKQGLRWNNGGLFAPDLSTRLGFGTLMVAIALGVLSAPLAFFLPVAALATVSVYLSMAMNVAAVAVLAGGEVPCGPRSSLGHWLLTPAYFGFLTILGFLPIPVFWKGRRVG